MKNINLIIFRIFLSLSFIILLNFGSNAQLSGNYTIDPTIGASNSNYQNWASAVGDLISGTRTDGGTAQGSGVGGPVVFTVYDTIYSTQVYLSAISGASSTNTITFKSTNDSSKCVIQYASGTATTDDYILMLDGADYVTIKNIGFERTGSNAYYTVIKILNNADYNSFIGCQLKTRKVPSSTSTGWITGVGAVFFFAGNADYTTISQNKIIYGYNGIYSATASTGNTVSNNVFDTNGCIGTYMTQQTALMITGNTFNMGDFGSGQGHYISYAIRLESSPSPSIMKNKIYMLANNAQVVRCIVLVSCNGTSTTPGLINNNWLLNAGGTSACTGMSLYGASYLDIYYNNCLITTSMAASAIVHHNTTYTQTYVDIKNNNFINKGGGYVYDFPGTNGGLDTVEYNNLYTNGSYIGRYGSTTSNYSTLNNWISATGKDATSLNIDPGYVSNTNLHVSNIGINAKATPYWRVTDDIDGETRDTTTPDIGADEFFPAANDAGISSLDSPQVFCSGTRNVKITFQNYGSDTLKSLKINWQVNGVSKSPYIWSGLVDPGNSSASISLGTYAFSLNTAYVFKIWGSNPNASTDGNNLNDTLTVTRYTSLAGNYSIGSTGDFQSFNNAISAMTSRGICGAVVFNVSDGIYNEQLTLAELPGMGASNPVTFKSVSGDSTTVIINLPSTSATGNNNAAVQLAGADYVTIKGMTIRRTGTNSISQVVHILNGSNHNTFSNCQMINTYITSANATGINIWSDQGTDEYNVFRNNYVKFGTYNMFYQGTSTGYEYGTVIEGNVFDSAYSNAVHLGYQLDVTVNKNIFRNSISHVTSNYDLQLLECDSATWVNGNSFYNANTDIAIHLTACNATNSSNPGIISNNFIAKGSVTGILLDLVTNQDVVFNSISLTGTATTNSGISTTSGTSTNIVLKNNNIVMNGGYLFNINAGSQISSSNHNNLKSFSSLFAYWGNAYNSLSSLASATGKDANSISVDPLFLSATNLHVKNTALKRAGEPINGVTTDIDGETRNTSTPDIGADEFALQPYDAAIVNLTNPVSVSCEGVQQVKAVIKNWGTNSLTSATINWTINSTSQSPKSWTGNLSTFGIDTVVLGNYSFTGNTNPSIVVWSSSPNAQTDGLQLNDTFMTTRQIKLLPTANAGTDKDLCIGDSIMIGPSSSTGYSYKWMTMSNTVIGTTAQIYVNPTADANYVLEVTDNAAGCSNTDTMKVVIRYLPVSGFTVNNSDQCLNDNNFVFTNTSTGASTYLWNFGDTDTSTAANPSHTYDSSNAFNVKLSAISMYGCIDTTSMVVNVKPKPITWFIANNLSQCLKGNSFVFTNMSSGQTSDYWDFGDTTFSTNSSPSPKTYMYEGAKAVKLLTTNSYGCKDSVTKYVNVRPHPVTSFTINNATQCLNGNSFTYTNNSMISTGTYTDNWDFGDNSYDTASSPTMSYMNSGNYVVKLVTTSDFGCKDSTTDMTNVYPAPMADFSLNADKQCFRGNLFVFSNNSTISGGTINAEWNFGDGDTSTVFAPSHSYMMADSFNVSLMITSDKGCSDSAYGTVIVFPQPMADVILKDTGLCLPGNNFSFTDNSTISNDTIAVYSWDFGDGNSAATQNSNHSYIAIGDYILKHIVSSSNGCSDSILKMLFVYPNPQASFLVSDTIQCKNGNQFQFTNTSTINPGSLNFLWDLGDGTSKTDSIITHTYANVGTYELWLKVTSMMNCSDSATKTITIKANPVVNLGADTAIKDAESLNLDAGSGFAAYLWSNSATTRQITVDSTAFGLGIKTIWVKVTQNGCNGFDTIIVTITQTISIDDPKAGFKLMVYPNPVSSLLNIELSAIQKEMLVTLTDMNGKQLKSIRIMPDNLPSLHQIDISELARGVYYLNISNSKSRKVTKFVKY